MFVPLTPLRCLHRAIDVFGSKTGIVSGDRSFTYAQFGERCEKLATGLPKFGIRPGDRVAYLSFNTHQLIEGYYGVVQARGIVMPLNVRLSEVELTSILCHSGARMLMFEDDFAPMVEKLRKSCPAVEKWVALDGQGDLSYEEILDAGHPERADIFTYDEMSVAELFYTSGSTGTPKGVTLAHRTLYLHALDVCTIMKDIESMVDLHTIPMFHANGWGRPQASTYLGIPQVMVRRFEPAFVYELIQKHKATDMCLVPTMANAMINCADREKWNTSSMRRVMIGGAAASPELVERVEKAFPSAECIAGYGLTETAPVLTSSRHKVPSYATNEERLRRQAMAGWPLPGVTVGDHIMEGYYQEPEATAAVMTGPWFHSGDMAVWDEDGYIHIVDRKKEIIISGGENISSLEVERAIFSHPAVFECAVVAAPSDKWGEVPAAIVVLKPGESVTSEGLMAFLEQRLGKFKLPRIIEFSSEPLPKTGTGKIRKMIIKEKFWAGKEKRVQG